MSGATKIVAQVLQAIAFGEALIPTLERALSVSRRLKGEGRTDPTDAELDEVRGDIIARQERIDKG